MNTFDRAVYYSMQNIAFVEGLGFYSLITKVYKKKYLFIIYFSECSLKLISVHDSVSDFVSPWAAKWLHSVTGLIGLLFS